MAEKKVYDMSDNLQSSEIPLKKRKDSRLSNCSSASWRIENSQTGNPLKKRFFRSLLPCDEDKSSSRTSVKKRTYFSSINEEENIFTSDPNSALSENRTPLEENGIINLSSANKDLYFSHRDKKMILKPSKNDLDILKSDFERDVTVNKEHKLLQLNNLDSPYGIFAGIKDVSYNKKSAVNSSPTVIPGVQDLSCKNSSPNSTSLISDSKTFLEAMNFITSIYGGVSDSSKKLRSNENSDIKRPKTEECHLIPETDKTTLKHKEECDWSNNTQSVLVHNVNGNSEKSRLISGSSPVLSQDKVFPSPLLSNYVDYFCNSEINTTPSQKAESLFPQESHSHLSGESEQSALSLQQSADNAVSFNKEDTYNYLSSSNLSNAEHEFTSEVKKEDKYFSRSSSSLDNLYIQSNSSKSPLDFSLLLKTDVPRHEEVSEVREGNEKHNIDENFSEENADHIHLKPLKSSVYFSKEKSVPPHDATSEIPSNMAASSSHVNTDYIHSRTLKSPLFLSLLLKSNENSVPPKHENHCDVGASSSQENPCYKPSTLDIRFFKCIDNIRNNGDSDFSPMSCLKDKKDNKFYTTIESSDKQLFKNHLSQFNIAKVKEESVTEEDMLPSNQSEFEQNLLSEKNKESKKKFKYFPSYSFSKREEERKDDNELENTLIDVCKEQLRNYASVSESIPKQKTSEGSLFHKYGRESEKKSEHFSGSNIFTKSKKEDKLKNALIEVCEEELKNSFESSPSYAKRCDPVNELQGKISPGRSYKQEDCVIDLCSNNDKRTNDDGNDDDVKVIKVLNNQNSDIVIENCMRPMFSTTQLDSFESVFQCRPSTSKCHSKFHSPTLPLDMSTPQMVRNKSVLELLPSSSHTASGSQQAHQNERNEKNYPWDPVLLNSNDDYLSISSPESVINISSSSPSPSSSPHQQSKEIEDEIFGSLIRAMDFNQHKRPSVLKTGKKLKKEIPVLTLPEDDSSDEDKDLRRKKSKLSEKGRKGESSSRDTAKVNEMRPELECAICLESMSSKRGTSATTCGHVYCTPCIDEVIEKKGECPTCRKPLDSTQVHKLFLFA